MQLIDGKLVAAKMRAEIASEVARLREKGMKKQVGLAVIFVGDDPASQVYVRNKIKACEEVGINSYLCKLPQDSSFEDVAATTDKLNRDENVSGIILQLPIPRHSDTCRKPYTFVCRLSDNRRPAGSYHSFHHALQAQTICLPCFFPAFPLPPFCHKTDCIRHSI